MLDIEDRNFENLVIFYSYELRQIQAGSIASRVLSYKERNRLKRYGILIAITGSRAAKIKITKSAQNMLKDLESARTRAFTTACRACAHWFSSL